LNFLLLINYHDFLYKNAQIPKQSHTFRVLNMAPQQSARSRDYPSQKAQLREPAQWHEPTRRLSSHQRAGVQCVQGDQRSCIRDDYRIWAVLTRRSRSRSEPSDRCRGMAGIRKGSRRRQQRVCACVNT